MRVAYGGCVPCTAGFYCPPCLQGAACDGAGVQIERCFEGSTSLAGAYAQQQCFCQNAKFEKVYMQGVPVCRALPFGMRLVGGQLVCLEGWQLSTDRATCTLCSKVSHQHTSHQHCQDALS